MTEIDSDFFQNKHLDGGSLEHIGPLDSGVLLIHGFTATTVEVRLLADHLISQGFSVSAPLLPGHRTSPSDLNKKKYSDWIKTVEKSFLELEKRCRKVIVGGESMGAVLTMYLAEKYPQIAAIYLFSPALLVKKLKYTRVLRFIQPFVDKNLPADDLPWQGYTVYPSRAGFQFFKLTRIVRRSLSKITSPTLIFQGRYDKTIDEENGNYIFNTIHSKIRKKILLESSGHVMLLDDEIQLINQYIDDFNKQIQIL